MSKYLKFLVLILCFFFLQGDLLIHAQKEGRFRSYGKVQKMNWRRNLASIWEYSFDAGEMVKVIYRLRKFTKYINEPIKKGDFVYIEYYELKVKNRKTKEEVIELQAVYFERDIGQEPEGWESWGEEKGKDKKKPQDAQQDTQESAAEE